MENCINYEKSCTWTKCWEKVIDTNTEWSILILGPHGEARAFFVLCSLSCMPLQCDQRQKPVKKGKEQTFPMTSSNGVFLMQAKLQIQCLKLAKTDKPSLQEWQSKQWSRWSLFQDTAHWKDQIHHIKNKHLKKIIQSRIKASQILQKLHDHSKQLIFLLQEKNNKHIFWASEKRRRVIISDQYFLQYKIKQGLKYQPKEIQNAYTWCHIWHSNITNISNSSDTISQILSIFWNHGQVLIPIFWTLKLRDLF